MIVFAVSGAWTAQRAPQLLVDYPHPAIEMCNDISGPYPPTDPNIGMWECTAEAAALATIEADSDYCVFWDKEVVDEAEI